MDGPPAATQPTRFSRLGCLPLLDWLNPDAFVVVIDDAERPGEQALGEHVSRLLDEKRVNYRRGGANAAKRQIVFAGGRFLPAAFF